MQSSLHIGDEVVIGGGMFGILTEIDDDAGTVRVEIAPGTQIRMLRQGVLQRVTEDEIPTRTTTSRPTRRPTTDRERPRRAGAPDAQGGSAPDAGPETLTFEEIQGDAELSALISAADRVMEGMGYTEHGFRHANLTARIAYNVLTRAGFDEHREPGVRRRHLHDVGNMLTRDSHGQTGGLLVYRPPRADAGGGPGHDRVGDREPRGEPGLRRLRGLGGGDPGRQVGRAPQSRSVRQDAPSSTSTTG